MSSAVDKYRKAYYAFCHDYLMHERHWVLTLQASGSGRAIDTVLAEGEVVELARQQLQHYDTQGWLTRWWYQQTMCRLDRYVKLGALAQALQHEQTSTEQLVRQTHQALGRGYFTSTRRFLRQSESFYR